LNFLKNKYALLLTAALLLQIGIYYGVAARHEIIPTAAPLDQFPVNVGDWRMTAQYPLTDDIERVLKADDTLNRDYFDPKLDERASLWIAYYRTQRYGQTPHSPKACLPGAGWEAIENGNIRIAVPDWPEEILANKYVVSNGEDAKMVAIYWYQSHHRVIASEYSARFWLVLDSMRYRRSDTSLIRVLAQVQHEDYDAAARTAVTFVKAVFPAVLRQLPN